MTTSLKNFLLCRQQLLTNPGSWQTGKHYEQTLAELLQFASTKDPSHLSGNLSTTDVPGSVLVCFHIPYHPTPYENRSFTGSWTVCSNSVSTMKSIYGKEPHCFPTWKKTSLESTSRLSIVQAPLLLHKTGICGLMPPPRRGLQAFWHRKNPSKLAGLDANGDTFSFFGRSINTPKWTQGVVQLACKCFHSTKNCSGLVFAGLLPTNPVKGKSASTSYENNLTRFHPLVHSCSSDRRWAVRFVAARIDIFVLSDRSKANFSPDAQHQKIKLLHPISHAGPD